MTGDKEQDAPLSEEDVEIPTVHFIKESRSEEEVEIPSEPFRKSEKDKGK